MLDGVIQLDLSAKNLVISARRFRLSQTKTFQQDDHPNILYINKEMVQETQNLYSTTISSVSGFDYCALN